MPVYATKLPEARQRPFVTYDGHHLALFDWVPPSPTRPRAVVLMLHGRGEHAWLYDALASSLNAAGFAVRAYDQRGHGSSAGKRGVIPQEDTLLRDLTEVIADTRLSYAQWFNLPIVVLGHELGALVAASWISQRGAPPTGTCTVDGLVLSAMLMQPDTGLLKSSLLSNCPDWLGNACVSIPSRQVVLFQSHVALGLRHADPLCHRKQSIRLAKFISRAGSRLLSGQDPWTVPTLVLHGDPPGAHQPTLALRWATHLPREWVRIRNVSLTSDEADGPVICAETALLAWLNNRF